ncbi:MAG: hypothetical protein FHK82_10230 [Sedimenticola thiotaurini]|uniref:Uncharacterized protein n=1 Tax=Sedimenticola thiotaurini TaxID=1543721 RepID=A0A558D0L7_9GAMM|nr:MAG: hypothetical protein FHK82_10230 [Sedimenticola thiotaurini]
MPITDCYWYYSILILFKAKQHLMLSIATKSHLTFYAALLLVTFSLQQGLAGTAVNGQIKPQSAFNKLALKISSGDTLERYDFVSIALNELILAYQKSYQESSNEQPAEQHAQLKLARWRRGLGAFIDQLSELQNNMEFDDQIDIIVQESIPITLYINNNPVVLSGPEIVKASQIEQNITNRYCRLHDCSRYNDIPSKESIIPQKIARGRWQINHKRDTRYETPDGLVFMFHTLDEREQKQKFCETVANDLRLFVSQIKRAQHAGYQIEWEAVSVATLHDGKTGHVIINSSGDYLTMDFKLLNRYLLLDKNLLSWIKKTVTGEQPYAYISDTDKLWLQTKQQ